MKKKFSLGDAVLVHVHDWKALMCLGGLWFYPTEDFMGVVIEHSFIGTLIYEPLTKNMVFVWPSEMS